MARPAARRRVKNPSAKTSRKTMNRRMKRQPSFAGVNPLIALNWDKKLTLKQNYAKLGLVSTLNGRAGGVQDGISKPAGKGKSGSSTVEFVSLDDYDQRMQAANDDPSLVPSKESSRHPLDVESQDSFVHDDANGPIRVDARALLIGESVSRRSLPTKSAITPNPTSIIAALEELASQTHVVNRHQSEQEVLWITECVERHGLDYLRMARDLKVNRMQMTPMQIQKKIVKFLRSINIEL